MIEEHGDLPQTLTAESPSGSLHFYFKWLDDCVITNSTSQVGPGIDVRGEGGMVIAPPSVKPPVGCYSWTSNVEPVEAPGWLIALVLAAGNGNGNAEREPNPDLEAPLLMVEAAVNAIPNNDLDWETWNTHGMAIFAASGGSNDGFILFDRFSKKSAKYDDRVTIERWHSYHRSPPFGSLHHWACEADPNWLQDYDARIEAQLNKATREWADEVDGDIADLGEAPNDGGTKEKEGEDDPGSGNGKSKTKEKEGEDPGKSEPKDEKPKQEEPPKKHFLQSSGEFVANFVPPDYLIDGILQRRYVSSFTAPTGDGKTAVILCAAAHAALGLKIGDRDVDKVLVVFFAGENPDDVRSR